MNNLIDDEFKLTKKSLENLFEHLSDVKLSSKTYYNDETPQEFLIIYAKGTIDTDLLYNSVLPSIEKLINNHKSINLENLNYLLEVTEIQVSPEIQKNLETNVFSGQLLLFHCQNKKLFSINLAKSPQRSIDESNMEVSIRGPKDGFVESSEVNIALIRKRLKTTSLSCEEFTVGTRSNTTVTLLYLNDVINPILLNNVKSKIEKIETDIITSSYHIEENLYDNPFSLFPLIDYTGRPDYVAQSLNQGRFAILVDGNPSCLIGPVNINLLLKTPEDNQTSFFYASIERLLRITALFTTIFLPGFWIALISFHFDQIPFPLLATIVSSRIGLPFSASIEMFIMLIFFELFKEAGVRLPKTVGQTVAVLGGLIVGDAAIRAGLTSPSALVIASIAIISSYTLVNQNLAGNIIFVRMIVLALSSFAGMYGFLVGVFLIFANLSKLESFGYPYLAPFNYLNKADLVKTFIKLPLKYSKYRNKSYFPKDPDSSKE